MTGGRARLGCLLVVLLGVAGPAAAVDVSQLSDFESNPCVVALARRNAAQHVDAPDSALSDNCDRAHGNADVAWDFLLRTWQPRESVAVPLRPGVADLAWASLEALLAYAVLGAPMRAITRMLRPPADLRPRVLAEAGLALLVRLGIGATLLAILALPFMTLLGSVVALAALVAAVRREPNRTQPGAPSSALAEIVAGVANDAIVAAPGLLALTMVARGDWRALAAGVVVLGGLVSVPGVRRGRLALRRSRLATTVAAVLLAVGLALLGLADPSVARAGDVTSAVIVSIAFVGVVLWRTQLGRRFYAPRQKLPGD